MLYILRLTDGDCVVVEASDEQAARRSVGSLGAIASTLSASAAAVIASVRPLAQFGVRFSPTEEGCLEVERWDDASLEEILANEYPLLDEACRRANSEPFGLADNPAKPALLHLKAELERNTEIIRQGLSEERRRFDPGLHTKSRASGV